MLYCGGDRNYVKAYCICENRICSGMRFNLCYRNGCRIIFNCAMPQDLQVFIFFLLNYRMICDCSILHCLLTLKVILLSVFESLYSYMFSIKLPYIFHWHLHISILVRGMKSNSYSGETVLDSLWSRKAILCLYLHGWLIFLTPWPTWINSV